MSASVFWITGLSGAGKTTVSKVLAKELRDQGCVVFELDGDVLREIIGHNSSHSVEERFKLAKTYGRFAHELSEQGIIVICATISMFYEVRDWNRENIEKYHEIYLKVPREVLEARDPKDIYKRVNAGELSNVVGIDIPMEEPKNPDLTIENYADITPEIVVKKILDSCSVDELVKP